ncbi:CobN/magnesium chelatase family protein [Azotobacter vinelandii CA]|uniref:CobN/magnesium chelatase family protein n=3 Tax=Azotobacter group TaxID=351 RepID=C1DKS0_AZOVD|nr:CobN/magnesium chelatase family protein [Azotobacter vinelandii DJ]AGK16556.1 CobN/magnesium chelatase family protein [Azotobacter vinelandii CA]AGK20848.1 CobN/magnesium chelatase family protein [Azotobacter vinelandii CA6]
MAVPAPCRRWCVRFLCPSPFDPGLGMPSLLFFRRFGLAVLLGLLAPWASATQLNTIVSRYSAAEFAGAAAQFQRDNPQWRISARTPEQLAELDESALRVWLGEGRALLGVGLFGAEVERLGALLGQVAPADSFLMHSEHALVQLSRSRGQPLFDSRETVETLGRLRPQGELAGWIARRQAEHPRQADWIAARSYWQAGGIDNIAGLLAWLAARHDPGVAVPAVRARPPLRFYQQGALRGEDELAFSGDALVAVIDHGRADRAGDRELNDAICRRLESQGLACVSLFADWGPGSLAAVRWLKEGRHPPLAAIVVLQDFVVGGGEGREEVTGLFERLNVPVLKGLRLEDRDETGWQLSGDGLARDKVHYQLAMSELQGSGQAMVLAAWHERQDDPLSGIRFGVATPLPAQLDAFAARIRRWCVLQQKANADKRLAIVYYNHPPGRHNIGADNLDVPQSLFEILTRLKADGYDTGPLPESPTALLDLLQERGVNLPEQGDALTAMADKVQTLSAGDYRRWFETLPAALRAEMVQGPLGYWHAQLRRALDSGRSEIARGLFESGSGELHHVLDGVVHPARQRALDLLAQLEAIYRAALDAPGQADWAQAERLVQALAATGIEGLRGWGEAPGRVMVQGERLLLPGIRFGKVFVGPQPPRGWEIDQELLHANLVFPPPHQYLAFYHWLRDDFRADALIHLGRHSTYEFLPRRRAGLSDEDYPMQVVGDLPSIYPYIVDGVGEGIQAKRRGLAVMIDHLTPPLVATPLYDDLLRLRQLIESFEAGSGQVDGPARRATIAEIRRLIGSAGLEPELRQSMAEPLAARGIGFEQADDDLLVHELGHYLTAIQERFMPMGLHVFGKPWRQEAVDTLVRSMGEGGEAFRPALVDSPRAEMAALLNALNGRFVAPGKGNDPIRTPEALPTGRNFHALDSSLLPSRIGWRIGSEMAAKARARPLPADGREAVILWASDTVRDEGAMIAFGLALLGIEPQWNSRGIVEGIRLRELAPGEQRRDLLFTTSGLFRDLYADQLALLERAVLLALNASAERIRRDYPALRPALAEALAPLQGAGEGGGESLEGNRVAAHWVEDAAGRLKSGLSAGEAGRLAALRLFGVAPGAYGAGINRLVERSGSWQERGELARAYVTRMGHAYGLERQGEAAQAAFADNLKQVRRTYLGRSSNLYGLMDNNDAFDYLGGLSLAVEQLSGQAPENFVAWHNDPAQVRLQPLPQALLAELRGRFLNPAWIEALMRHDYAGARTMGSEFLEYLWGWQVTNPEIIGDSVWEEVKAVYLDDRYQLGLADFLERGPNVHVKSNMLALMLVAIHKGFWQADEATVRQLGERFARLVDAHGLPGSGHTRPDHPMLQWLLPQLPAELRAGLERRLRAAQLPTSEAKSPSTLSELQPAAQDEAAEQDEQAEADKGKNLAQAADEHLWLALAGLMLLLGLGIWRGRGPRVAKGV